MKRARGFGRMPEAVVFCAILLFSGLSMLSAEELEMQENVGAEEGFTPVPSTEGAGKASGGTDVAEELPDRISLDLRNIEISEALRFLATRSKMNMVISKAVSGRLFLILNNVPIKDVLDIILLSSDLAYDKQGEIYQIMTGQEYRSKYGRAFSDARKIKLFRLQYAVPDRVFSAVEALKSEIGRVLVDQESGMVMVMDTPENMAEIEKVIQTLEEKRTVRAFALQYAKAKDLEDRLKAQLDAKGAGTVQVDERTNQLIVQTFPDRMEQIARLIESLDQKTKAVLIVSKIIKVTLSDNFEAEIQWEGMFKSLLGGGQFVSNHVFDTLNRGTVVSDSTVATSFLDNYPKVTTDYATPVRQGAKNVFLENLVVGQQRDDQTYEVLIKFLKTLGETRVLSSPRITVVNNQEAKIHVGERQAYITSTTTTGSTGQNTVAESVTFIDVGIELSVTPTINDDGFITMKIKPSISSVVDELETASGNTIPIVDTSEAETTVMVKDKTSIVIAGLRKDEFTESKEEVPFVADIPIFGNLFRSGNKKKVRTEVIVLLTPYLTGSDKMMTGEPGKPVDTFNDYRSYPELSLDPKTRKTGASSLTQMLKKLPFVAHD